MSTLQLSDLVDELELVNHQRKRPLELMEAIVAPPVLTLRMDGANDLTITVADADRRLLRSPLIGHKSWAEVDGCRFELVGLAKTGDQFTLTFEDGIAAALRRRDKALSVPAGRTTRREFAIRLAREADVPYAVDPTKRPPVARVLERSTAGEKSNSWDVLGELAEDVRWRRFSDGRRLIVGSDDWLFDRDNDPLRLREFTGPVQGIDFDLDVGKRASEASVEVDAKLWALRPGSVCKMNDDMGPAEGKWLVSEFSRPLTSTRGTVKLVRGRHALKEPKKKGPGEKGDPDYVPTPPGNTGAGAGNSARERMVRFALAQRGKAYVWGGNGPDGYDCSGLVQKATAAGGRQLTKPSASQWATCVNANKNVPVATALRTRGALLFRIGVGEYNHVAISLGNGSTIEARGTGYGVNVFGGAGTRGWTGGAIWL